MRAIICCTAFLMSCFAVCQDAPSDTALASAAKVNKGPSSAKKKSSRHGIRRSKRRHK